MLQVLKFRQCALWSEADTFDELSRATVEALKKGLVNSKDYKRMEPLLDFGFALADGQLASALKELVNTDLASELDVPTSATDGNAALTGLRDALGSLTHVEKVESVQATVPKMSWSSWRDAIQTLLLTMLNLHVRPWRKSERRSCWKKIRCVSWLMVFN